MMNFFKKISPYINQDEIIDLTCQLIQKKTINPPGNEHLVKEIVVESLKALGAEVKIMEKEKGRPNILGYIGEGKPSVAILAHMDVVPPGNGWEGDPFSPRLREGKIYGRGALDNKGPYAAAWAGVKAILDSSFPFKGSIILGTVADEERGSGMGMKFLLEEGFSSSFCIIPDGGRINEVIMGEKGAIRIKLSACGKLAHASTPEKGENAIYKMVSFLSLLSRFKFNGEYHSSFSGPTLNLGQIKGGIAPNVVPDECEAIVDIRYPLGMEKENLISQLRKLANKEGLEIGIEMLSYTQPHLLEEGDSLISAFRKVGENIGMKISFGTMGGNTIAKNLYFKGIPSVAHSPEEEPVAHQANEYVKVDNLILCAKLWAGVIYELIRG
ncbi:MAG: ArgE/DapE family deacylase [Candidatus Aerophobetes bacterium]|nr:ArgE/DapE family deacylase [Candidatus Aerophobetes bacterium]